MEIPAATIRDILLVLAVENLRKTLHQKKVRSQTPKAKAMVTGMVEVDRDLVDRVEAEETIVRIVHKIATPKVKSPETRTHHRKIQMKRKAR